MREKEKAEMESEIAEGRSEYEKNDAEADDNRRAFWQSTSKHTPGKFHFVVVPRSDHLFGTQIAHGSFAKMTESLAIPDQNFQKGIP